MNLKKSFSKIVQFIINNKLIVSVIFVIFICLIFGIVLLFNFKNSSLQKNEMCFITFDTSGGTPIEDLGFECGTAVEDPKLYPKKEGFTFMGWTYLNQPFIFGDKYNENIILVADYMAQDKENVVIVSFDTDGGTPIKSIEILKNKTVSPPLVPSKIGYDFEGWYLNDEKFDFNSNIIDNITLKAKWKKGSSSSDNKGQNSNIKPTPSNYKCTGGYSNKVEKRDVIVGYNDHVNWTFSTGISYSPDSCFITYKSSNKNIASVSDSGVINALKSGKVYIYECINDSDTKKEIGCFKGELNIKVSSDSDDDSQNGNNTPSDNDSESTLEEEQKKAMAFANSVNGNYWYLDGFDYAYLYPTIMDWHDHTLLNWDSKYIKMENNKFVTSEETGVPYYFDDNIHNNFLANPTELGWHTFSQYNMKVSGSKLYITIGGKTYSFTKYASKKMEKVSLSLKSNRLTIDKGEVKKVDVKVKNYFIRHSITISSTNSSIATCSGDSSTSSGTIQLTCRAFKPGTTRIKIKDSNGESSIELTITVNNVVIPVKGISLNKSNLDLLRGSSTSLSASVSPSNADNKSIIWTSSDNSIATVSSSGKVTAISEGSAIITATTDDGGFSSTCTVNVSNPPLRAEASIGVSTIVSSGSASRGIKVTISAEGGTGSYNYYFIKLYKDGNLISQSTNPNTYSNSLFIEGHTNGSYYVEYEVRDTDGRSYSGTSSTTTISGF